MGLHSVRSFQLDPRVVRGFGLGEAPSRSTPLRATRNRSLASRSSEVARERTTAPTINAAVNRRRSCASFVSPGTTLPTTSRRRYIALVKDSLVGRLS